MVGLLLLKQLENLSDVVDLSMVIVSFIVINQFVVVFKG
jgi:hypothetical protein